MSNITSITPNDILLVLSSPRGSASNSTQVARSLVEQLRARNPRAKVTVRDLGAEPLPHITEAYLAALGAPAETLTAEQRAGVALSDTLIAELEAADTIVIASAMINFAITSTLKTWIDYVARAQKTFRYTEAGVPEGLLKGKKLYLVEARGGFYTDEPMKAADFQDPYLKHMLGFIGLTDVEVIAMEGMVMGPEIAEKSLSAAQARVSAINALAA